MDMDVNRKQVTRELHHFLHEWGVSGTHKAHVSFRKKVIREGLRILSLKEGSVRFEKLKGDKFPTHIHEAYEYVLRHDDVDRQEYCTNDKVGIYN